MRKTKKRHPVFGLMNMIIGILTPMRQGDRDFQRFNLMRKPDLSHSPSHEHKDLRIQEVQHLSEGP